MTGVIGVIDGCQIAIAAPPENDGYYSGNTFRNRKGYHSLNVLMCCNADMHITYANARFPGSVHDSAIWLTSKLRHFCVEKFTHRPRPESLLIRRFWIPVRALESDLLI